jgi:hypothetical protein
MYYFLFPDTDESGNMMGLEYRPDHRARSFVDGRKLVSEPSLQPWRQPPQEPVRLRIKQGREDAPFPTFLREPVPLMSKALYEIIRSAGVDNIDVYRAELYYSDGRLASDQYYVFNLLGLVKAVDLSRSKFDRGQPDRLISMGFDSVVIDRSAAGDFLMFRLAENVTTIVIHERVKRAIEKAGVPLLRADPTENVALL